MTKILEVNGRGKCAREEKIKKEALLGLMKVLDANSLPRRVIKRGGKAVPAASRKNAPGTRLSQANLVLLREYFAICVALRREYNGVEGV